MHHTNLRNYQDRMDIDRLHSLTRILIPHPLYRGHLSGQSSSQKVLTSEVKIKRALIVASATPAVHVVDRRSQRTEKM